MQVKIPCSCGTRYAFDVEPVNGRMPVRVNCPTCGADGTDAANAIIRGHSAGSDETRPRLRIDAPTPTATARSSPVSGALPAEALQEAATEFCSKHRQEPATSRCCVCQKPICPKCLEQFGYLCSVYCQNQAVQHRLPVPVYEGQKAVVQQKERRKEKRILAGAALALLAVVIAWGWYAFVGSRPKMLFSIQIPKFARSSAVSRLVTPDELLLFKDNRLASYHPGSGKEIWSTALTAGKSGPRPKAGPLGLLDDESSGAQMQITGEDVWVCASERVTCVDRKTGKIKTEVPIHNAVRQVTFTDASLLVLAEDETKRTFVTHIILPAGTARTEEVTEAILSRPAKGAPALSRAPQPRFPDRADDSAAADFAALDSVGDKEFLPAGANVIQLKAKLLEKRMVAYEAIKKPGASTLNDPALTARDSMKASAELLNEMQRERTGGVAYENESRYQATLRRFAPADAPDWTGEVNGPPAVFPQKTVDVLVAGKSLTVFNKKNAKLWESKLTFPISDKIAEEYPTDNASAPCLEESGSLYFFDKGVLTAFDLRSGNARWRVPSVGVSRIARDNSGMLYVATTSASPDSIQYSQQIRIDDKAYPVLLKIDPASGKVLWRAEHIGDQCFASGKFVYATRSQISGLDMMKAAMNNDTGVPVHFRIYRLKPAPGTVVWEYYQPKAPRFVQVQKNRILLQFADEVQVVGF